MGYAGNDLGSSELRRSTRYLEQESCLTAILIWWLLERMGVKQKSIPAFGHDWSAYQPLLSLVPPISASSAFSSPDGQEYAKANFPYHQSGFEWKIPMAHSTKEEKRKVHSAEGKEMRLILKWMTQQ